KEAAMALGLLSDDREHVLCLEEAVKLQTPSMIRYLFAFILSLGVTVRPVTLYDQFKGDMMADYFSPHPAVPLSAQEKEIRLFRDLTKLARKFSYEFADSGIQAPQGFTEEQIDAHINRAELSAAADTSYRLMNADQKSVFDAILASALDANPNTAKCYCIDGPAGTGKTFVYRALYQHLTGMGKCVICVAYSGIAASLLPKGRTAHSGFRLKFSMTPDDY